MSRSLKVHERKDTVKWVLVALALLLVGAILCGLMTDWFREWNPFCWFGHNYGDDGKCTRCGKDKPAEEPKPEPEPQAFVSEPYRLFASADMLASDGVAAQASIPENLKVRNILSLYFDILTIDRVEQGFYDNYPLFVATNGSESVTIYLCVRDRYVIDSSETMDVLLMPRPLTDEQDFTVFEYFSESLIVNYTNDGNYSASFVPFSCSFCSEFQDYSDYVVTSLCSAPGGVSYSFDFVQSTELPEAPSKPGYTFTGWYTDEACTNKYTEDYVTGDITLYAGFQAHTYSIKFNANSGSGEMANLAMTYDTAKALTANGFTKEHYSFNGWATSADGDVVYANNAEVNNLTTEDNATVELFAKWERSEVCVTFVSESNTVATTWIAIGTKATLPETPVKEGHLFNGWYYEDGSKYTEQNISEDITLTAKFDVIRCTVTFMVDGEVYAVYVCDWGTSIAQALNGAGVNTVLYKADEHSANFQ